MIGPTDNWPHPMELIQVHRTLKNQPLRQNLWVFAFGHRQKFGNDPEKHVDFSAVTQVAKDKAIPPFLILFFAGNPDTRIQARRLDAVLKEAGIPVTAYGKRDSTHSRLNDDLGKPDDPATQEFYKFLDPLVDRK